MNLATQCPDCETIFLLSKEQSIARAGLVRCGACGHAFNALDHLEQAHGMPVVQIIEEPAAPQILPAGVPAELQPESQPGSQPGWASVIAMQPGKDTRPDAARNRWGEKRAANTPAHSDTSNPSDAAGKARATATASSESSAWSRYRRASGPEESDFIRPEPVFLKKARQRQQDLPSRTQRIVLALLILLTLIALLAQAAYVWRHELAAWQPALKPWLQRACEPLGCTVLLPAHLEQITIVSSELQAVPERADTYSLTLLLRNHSRLPQRLPALDLTLHDSQQQPLARRVILAQDYLSAQQQSRLAEGMAPDSELPVRIEFTATTAPATDYRLVVFYP